MNIMSIFHELVCHRAASVARGELKNIWHKMCFFTLCSCCASLIAVIIVDINVIVIAVVVVVVVVMVLNSPPSLVLIALVAKQLLPSTVLGVQSQNCLCAALVVCVHALET